MLVVTTENFGDVHKITAYHGTVTSEVIFGANVVKDFFAKIRDVVGGRSGSYEDAIKTAKVQAIKDLISQTESAGANALVGLKIDYEVVGQNGSMLMACASATAVSIEGEKS